MNKKNEAKLKRIMVDYTGINTDGDFNYETDDEIFVLCETEKEARNKIRDKLHNIYNTIKGNEIVVDMIKNILKEKDFDIASHGCFYYFGNQSIEIVSYPIEINQNTVKKRDVD